MTPLNFSIVREARVPVAHFARLVGASRITAATWVAGRHAPRGLYAQTAANVLTRIQQALDDKRLPLPRTARRDQYDALLAALA